MNTKNLVTKIALGVAAASLIFSVVTLIRAITLNTGVFMACILVVGTAIIVAICAIMLYVLSNYEAVEDDEEDTDEGETDGEAPKKSKSSRIKLVKISRKGSEKEDVEPEYEPADEEAESKEEPDEDAIEAEVDDLISDIESKNSYDLTNFE